MDSDDHTAPVSQTLEDLLESARAADIPRRVPEYRNALAAFGVAAIDRISAWLDDPRDGRFAVTVIEHAGTSTGATTDAIRILRAAATATADADFQEFVEAALARLGAGVKRPPRVQQSDVTLPPGYKVAPPYREAHHVVIDYAPDSGTRWGDLYLFACHRFAEGGWVRAQGGLKEPAGVPICNQCTFAVQGGA